MAGLCGIGGAAIGASAAYFVPRAAVFRLQAVFENARPLEGLFDKRAAVTAVHDKRRSFTVMIEE